MSEWPSYDPEISGKIEDRTERKGVLGTHGFAMVIGAVGGVGAFAAVGGLLGGPVVAVLLAIVGAFIGFIAGGVVAKALRPSPIDRSQHARDSAPPFVHDR